MTGWAKKRFWKEATICDQEGGFVVQLDGRLVKTPAKRTLLAPTEACAVAIAQEWQDQPEEIDPSLMPLTRAVNAAIDKVATQFDEVADLTAAYGETDLLCYRATSPEGLIARQTLAWDLVAWLRDAVTDMLDRTRDKSLGIGTRPGGIPAIGTRRSQLHLWNRRQTVAGFDAANHCARAITHRAVKLGFLQVCCK